MKIKILFIIVSMMAFLACNRSVKEQGVNEAGSADSDSMMNTDTLMVDTSTGKSGTDTGNTRVPVPTP